MIDKKIYGGKYPSAANLLIERGITTAPRQRIKEELSWADGIDIVYTLRDLTPLNFKNNSDYLLLLAYQEAMRYKEYKWKFAGFDVRLGRLRKGKDLPEIVTFQAAMHDDPEIMVYGPGYDTPQKWFLRDKVADILDIAKRYMDKVSKQNPYKVTKLFISIREPRE